MVEIVSFIRQQPDAVFILRSSLRCLDDQPSVLAAGRRAAGLVFRRASELGQKRRIVIKPNVTTSAEIDPQTQTPFPGQEGVVTNPWFVAGFIDGLREIDDAPVTVTDGTSFHAFNSRGYVRLMQERGIEVLSLNTPEFTETHYPTDGLNWYAVNGVVFRDLPFVRPIGDADVFHINMPKMKAHNLAITTLSIKNQQGGVALNYFRNFCIGVSALDSLPPRVRAHFQPDARERVEALLQEHVRAGFKRWNLQGVRDEGYAQRAVDALDGARPNLHVIEGCTIRDGTGFRHGTDRLGNYVIVGLNPVCVDAVATWIMGHDPCQIGLYRIAHERGRGENDPSRIAIFMGNGDDFRPVDYRELERVPAGVYQQGDTSALVFF